MLIPRFAKFPANAFPVCALGNFLHFFFIFHALLCVGVFARANLTFFLCFSYISKTDGSCS